MSTPIPLMRQVTSLRRLRRLLVVLAAATAVSVAAACRLPLPGRLIAGAVAFAFLVCWTLLLEVEGRAAARAERVAGRQRRPVQMARIGQSHPSIE